MKNRDFIVSMLVSILFGLLLMSILKSYEVHSLKPVKVDTTSDEYYRKNLDTTLLDHSRIPDE